MSSLVLIETRIPRKEGPDAVVTAEWFKAYEGANQYRVTWGAAEMYAQRGLRTYPTADAAIAAAMRCARRIYKGVIMATQLPYVQHKANGRIWRAGHDVYGLCAAWNHATSPYRLMTESEHRGASRYARAITNRMKRMGYVYGIHYTELSNGALFPLSRRNYA